MSDLPVLVADVGSSSLKAGYAGEDSPATVIPSTGQKCAKGLEVSELIGQIRKFLQRVYTF